MCADSFQQKSENVATLTWNTLESHRYHRSIYTSERYYKYACEVSHEASSKSESSLHQVLFMRVPAYAQIKTHPIK